MRLVHRFGMGDVPHLTRVAVEAAPSAFQSREHSLPSNGPSFRFNRAGDAPLPPIMFDFAMQVIEFHPANSISNLLIQERPRLPSLSPPVHRDEFTAICCDHSIKLNPRQLGFIPSHFWQAREISFGDLVADFFQRKNNSNSRFSHKLYNALKISESNPFFASLVGIEWVSERILKVDKMAFARLLGIKTIDGSLFHQQGNFPSHGFVELTKEEVSDMVPQGVLETVDYDAVRLLTHQPGVFTRHSTELAIDTCKWVSARRRPGS
jgi:hypothetical protein